MAKISYKLKFVLFATLFVIPVGKMGKPILYGTILSPPVRSVLLTAKAIGLDIELKEINLFEYEHKSDEFMRRNPQHTVPTLDDDGNIIWDSHAICTYLIGKYAKDDSLYPKDLYQRAQIDQRLHFDSGILFVRLRSIVENILFNNNPIIPDEKTTALYDAYNLMEKYLENSNYLVGNNLTVADLCCIATISSMPSLAPIDSEKYPKLNAWTKRLNDLPYYAEANGKGAKNVIDLYNGKIQQLLNQN